MNIYKQIKFYVANDQYNTTAKPQMQVFCFESPEEMKNALGLPILYRIDKLICFEEFSVNTIHKLVLDEISNRVKELPECFDADYIYSLVSPKIKTSKENQIVEYIVHNGLLKDFSVMQESPFTDCGSISEIFTDLTLWYGIIVAINKVNANALAA